MVNINQLMEKQHLAIQHIFEALSDSYLRQSLFLFMDGSHSCQKHSPQETVSIIFRHPVAKSVRLTGTFPECYPSEGIFFSLDKAGEKNMGWMSVASLILEIAEKNNCKSLAQILSIIVHFLDSLWESEAQFQTNSSKHTLPPLPTQNLYHNSHPNPQTSHIPLHLSQAKNSNILYPLFKRKLRELLSELTLARPQPIWLELSLLLSVEEDKVGIQKVLLNQDFNQEVKGQIESGHFFHKILKGANGLRSKKYLIQHYCEIIEAVEHPEIIVYKPEENQINA